MRKTLYGIMCTFAFCLTSVVKADETLISPNLISPASGTASSSNAVILFLGIVGVAAVVGVLVYFLILKFQKNK